jgi:opacity protein-like surface antigen
MKKLILLFIFLSCFTRFCQAESFLTQEPQGKIGLSFSVSVWDYTGLGNIEGGLGFKYKFSNNWIGRALVGISGFTAKSSSVDERKLEGNLSFALGIERHFPQKGFFSPYLGASLGYLGTIFDNRDDEGEDGGFVKRKQNGFPLTLYLGVEAYPSKRINLSIEYRSSIMYQSTIEDHYDYQQVWQSRTRSDGFSTGLDGSAIMLTIYF